MKEGMGDDNLAIAWEYPGQALEVIPAMFSLVKHTLTPCAQVGWCGATLDTWTGISGNSIAELSLGTNNFTNAPNTSTRLTNLLEGPNNVGDNYGSRMKGWLVPPISGDYTFWISSNSDGEFWLSTNSDHANKVLVCYQPDYDGYWDSKEWYWYPEQKSSPISLVAGQAYYYEVRVCVIYTTSKCSVRFHDK